VTQAELQDRIVAFAGRASIEATPHDEGRLRELTAPLRPGTAIYVAHPPRWTLQDVVRVAIRIRELGFPACPHIVARALTSERQLRLALSELRAAGIEQVLLVGGDTPVPAGPYSSALKVLETGATVDCGITTVAVAGHPEGHPSIAPELLWDALRAKQAFALRTATNLQVVTQFVLSPDAIFDWLRNCEARGIALPTQVGLAGPTPLAKLVHFAMKCGVGASLRSLSRNAGAWASLAMKATTPEEMLTALVRHCAAGEGATIVQPHFFGFGGSLETARWLRKVIDGAFDLNEEGSRFFVRS